MTSPRMLAMLGLVVFAAPATAKDITVQMKNKGADGIMVFEPAFTSAVVGDTVHFVPTDMGHNATPITGMIPEGADAAMGSINKEYTLKLTQPGLYGIKCTPHFSMGMVALVKAGPGPSPNAVAAAAVKLPPLAAKRMGLMLAKAN